MGKAVDTYTAAKGQDVAALYVAHLIASLNTLRRSAAREPDVDMHVEALQVLTDRFLLPADSTFIFPAAVLAPVVSHTLFMISCEGVDIGVQHGMERLLCMLADRLQQASSTKEVESHERKDAMLLLNLLLVSVVPALRKMLRAPHEEVYRTSLR